MPGVDPGRQHGRDRTADVARVQAGAQRAAPDLRAGGRHDQRVPVDVHLDVQVVAAPAAHAPHLDRGLVGQAAEALVLHPQHGHRRPLQDLGLGLDDRLHAPGAFEVHRPDRGDDAHVRGDPRRQGTYLALAVHPHLGDEDFGVVQEVLVDRPGQPGRVVP
jgi:hypothetical protein